MRRWYIGRVLAPALAALALGSAPSGAKPPADGVPVTVEETLGQRRYGYPASINVPLPRTAVREPANLALYPDAPEPASAPMRGVQYDALSRWPDGSLQWVMLSFNLSLGPLEKEQFRLRYGSAVSHPDPGPGVVTQTPEEFVIRNAYRIPRRGGPTSTGSGDADWGQFVSSIRYGNHEYLRTVDEGFSTRYGGGFTIVEPYERQSVRVGIPRSALYTEIDDARTSRIVSAGPLNAVVELRGQVRWGSESSIQPGSITPYRVRLYQPNSKSWLRVVVELDNPRQRELGIGMDMSYAIATPRVRYDFGADEWIYGVLRAPASGGQTTALLSINPDGRWHLQHGAETIARSKRARFEGWGHLSEDAPGGRAVAFGSPALVLGTGSAIRKMRVHSEPRIMAGQHWVYLNGPGALALRWGRSKAKIVRAEAFFHHVSDPIHVSAATSPAAMLHPLKITVPSSWYSRCRAGKTAPDDWPPLSNPD
jgi:hypothetical protein